MWGGVGAWVCPGLHGHRCIICSHLTLFKAHHRGVVSSWAVYSRVSHFFPNSATVKWDSITKKFFWLAETIWKFFNFIK